MNDPYSTLLCECNTTSHMPEPRWTPNGRAWHKGAKFGALVWDPQSSRASPAHFPSRQPRNYTAEVIGGKLFTPECQRSLEAELSAGRWPPRFGSLIWLATNTCLAFPIQVTRERNALSSHSAQLHPHEEPSLQAGVIGFVFIAVVTTRLLG